MAFDVLDKPETFIGLGFANRLGFNLWQVHLVVYVGEDVIFPFQMGQVSFIHMAVVQSLIEVIELSTVVFGAFDGVLDHGVGFHDEGPVAGLG